jgi:hypothetical protein
MPLDKASLQDRNEVLFTCMKRRRRGKNNDVWWAFQQLCKGKKEYICPAQVLM